MPITTLTTEAKNAATAAVLLTQEIFTQLQKSTCTQKVDSSHVGVMAATLAASILQGNLEPHGGLASTRIGR